MDAIRASAVGGGPRTSTSDATPCLSYGPTTSLSSATDFSPFLSPPLTKPSSVSYGQSMTTDVGFSLPQPLTSTSAAYPPSPFHVCVHRGQRAPITDVVREGEDEDRSITLKELSQKLQDFAEARDWEKYHTPRNLLLAMVGEVGELSEIFQWKGEVERGLEDWEESEKEHLGEELSDVLLYLIRLADVCGIDLAQASLNKILKNAIKYPLPPLDHS
ncbi:putative dCTP diphosphatase [Helianthus annuus]|uniref:Putative NTP pyrophosphohydrolase MazG, putative catalytic core n=1 Tax=Helianthus annuus TaxID=4232 RepID=A0A251VN40_HELAN|nr:uncharacterized protein LOC110870449 [Helianthus annuus]KAF5790344.1 putative dCTP diphosphatase [Helianthus annuus]KAJ0525567.1 putative dCTP diphosphatase [Helianthus annuus]KAJ0533729.1 putative dCTP diphosphatase [Helianthus annuus]KAJ0541952.1 putative dCTP diphosphatase [Helianthus annuus]KAJ0707020.1 putative dCTP diphosphatase [Helianthus annuus]